MSTNIIQTLFKSNKDNINNDKPPAYNYFSHISELNIQSKRHIAALQIDNNLTNSIIFDLKNENINGVDLSCPEDKQLFSEIREINENDNENNINNNPLSLNEAQIFKSGNNQINNNNNLNKNNFMKQMQNKKILANPKRKKQPKKNNKNNNKGRRNRSSISNTRANKSKSNNKSKTSQSSESSGNSTKRNNNLLKTHYSPEKYPDDYLNIDPSSSDEEKEVKIKEMEINNNSNSLFFKNILEKGKILNSDFDPKSFIEQRLKGYDLMSVQFKTLFRDNDFKKKYFKNIIADIKIVYFDKESVPLHAIFIFDNPDNNAIIREKIIYPGAYYKDEFIKFCSELVNQNKKAKVEMIMDFADISKYSDLTFVNLNPNLFIDFYILIDILG